MAHFALVDENNIVVNVVVISDEQEHRGQEYLSVDLGLEGRWIQTSYNSRGGVHYHSDNVTPTGKPALRKNYAGIGYRYDETLDAFIPPPFPDLPSFIVNPKTGLWEPPIPEPDPKEGGTWYWIEPELQWRWIENTQTNDEML